MTVIDIRANQHFEPLGIYAEGFLDSAVALFERACHGGGLADYAFYPAAFNLRHGIELFIKQMSIFVAYEHRNAALLYEPGHGLEEAWTRIRADVYLWETYAPAEGNLRDELDIIEWTLEELHGLDPGGTLFRYPEFVKPAKGSKPRVRKDQPPPFGVVNMRDWASSSQSVFDAVRSVLHAAHEFAGERAHERGDSPIHFHETVMKIAQRPNG